MTVGHAVVVLGAVLLAAYGGRAAARRLGQPRSSARSPWVCCWVSRC
ncbi:hypothetical protein ACFQYP_41750 [Nonomuraea antimicrobica]